MHNFKVMKNDGKFKVCDHEYNLCFTGITIVRQSVTKKNKEENSQNTHKTTTNCI